MTLARRRLRAQGLAGAGFVSAAEAVGALAAVQAQDYWAARWALGQRVEGLTGREVDRLLDSGAILRTHVLRPTWHFVLPADAGWLLELTGPRIRRWVAGRHRQLGLDGPTVARACDAIVEAVAGGNHLTRAELGAVLAAAGIDPGGQRLPHLLLAAEIDRLVISGARRGVQMTWALFSERVADSQSLAPDEAAARLAGRYFAAHGPAQLGDFAWWSGLTLRDARAAVDAAGLREEQIDGATHWSNPDTLAEPAPAGTAHLLPNFDEYLVAYRHRASAQHPEGAFDPALFAFGSILSNVVLVDGRVRGAWRRLPRRGGAPLAIELREMTPLRPAERAALDAPRSRLERFLETPVEFA